MAGCYRSAKDSAFTRVLATLTNEIPTLFPHDWASDHSTNNIPSALAGGIFCFRKMKKIQLLKVDNSISGQETFERVCSPLLKIRDAYPKMIIVRTKQPEYNYEGIEIHDIADWLL
jgi:hypothetical protein